MVTLIYLITKKEKKMLKEISEVHLSISEMLTILYTEIIEHLGIMVSFIIVALAIIIFPSSYLFFNRDEIINDFNYLIVILVLLSTILISFLVLLFIIKPFKNFLKKYVFPLYKFKKIHNSLSEVMFKISLFVVLLNNNEDRLKSAIKNYDEVINIIKNSYIKKLYNIRTLIENFIEDSKNNKFFFNYDNSKLFNLLVEFNNNITKLENIF